MNKRQLRKELKKIDKELEELKKERNDTQKENETLQACIKESENEPLEAGRLRGVMEEIKCWEEEIEGNKEYLKEVQRDIKKLNAKRRQLLKKL